MPQVIKHAKTKIVTKNGEAELSINIDPIVIEVTVNVNNDGNISVGGAKAQSVQKEEDPDIMVAPDFSKNTFGTKKVKFGKSS
ncbi:MAG: hypothetical protein DWQ19_12510 [Crenarchaeota archaeon]|nr:MAG: hypothetical protein DWQ19_12510 [Thermoproteota archaeon]